MRGCARETQAVLKVEITGQTLEPSAVGTFADNDQLQMRQPGSRSCECPDHIVHSLVLLQARNRYDPPGNPVRKAQRHFGKIEPAPQDLEPRVIDP